MCPIPRLLLVLGTTTVLALPVGNAHAAKPKANPWSAYFPAKGVSCTSTATGADGTTTTQRSTVVAKSATRVVTRISGEGRETSLLLPGGRLRTTSTTTDRASGMRASAVTVMNYPSPARLAHHGTGSGRVTLTMALPEKRAKALLSSGRTLTVTGTFRIAGLGTRAVTLADPAATTVEALGVRTRMRSFRMTHVKPTVAHLFTKIMRPLFRSLDETSWLAPGRESVRTDWADDGSVLTETQVGCG
jgi:hypothetical protein